jgi:hypothetical protein
MSSSITICFTSDESFFMSIGQEGSYNMEKISAVKRKNDLKRRL